MKKRKAETPRPKPVPSPSGYLVPLDHTMPAIPVAGQDPKPFPKSKIESLGWGEALLKGATFTALATRLREIVKVRQTEDHHHLPGLHLMELIHKATYMGLHLDPAPPVRYGQWHMDPKNAAQATRSDLIRKATAILRGFADRSAAALAHRRPLLAWDDRDKDDEARLLQIADALDGGNAKGGPDAAAVPTPGKPPRRNVRAPTGRPIGKSARRFDAFLCHVSEDKAGAVRPFAELMKEYDLRPWLDEVEAVWGDDLAKMIQKGLSESRFVVVFLSEAFLKKRRWADKELNAALSMEVDGRSRVLPILLGIGHEALEAQYPLVAAKIYKAMPDYRPESPVARDVLEPIVEDLKRLLAEPYVPLAEQGG